MGKKLHKKTFILLALLGLFNLNMSAQVSWEFTDAASGTDVWDTTTRLSAPVQNEHSVTYTTTTGNNPSITTSTAGITTGAASGDQSKVQTPESRRIMAITMRNGAGGPTYMRVAWPKATSGNFFANLAITNGDTNFKTYYLDLASYGAFNPGTNTPRAEWNGTKNDFMIQFKVDNGTGGGGNFNAAGVTIEIEKIEFVNNAWKGGSTNDNWGNNGNWIFSKPGVAGIAEDVLIPTEAVNANLNVDVTAAEVNSISFGAGAKLNNDSNKTIATNHIYFGIGSAFNVLGASDVSGIAAASYKMEMPDSEWHLISPPVVGEQYDDAWVTTNGIASGSVSGSNRGISTYDNGTPDATTMHWSYYQTTDPAVTFGVGVGHGIKRTSKGIVEFTGTGIRGGASFTTAISQGDQNWNLIGSQYTSYLNAADFIADNLAIFPAASQAIYVWNGTTYTSLTTEDLKVGQAFFMNNDSGAATATFNTSANSLDGDDSAIFYRNNDTKMTLSITSDNKKLNTYLSYIDGKTKGLDPGTDISLFDGVSSNLSIYTQLLENNEGIAFERQALPNSDLEAIIIPVGVKAEAGKEITFSAEALNLPTDIKVFLEDKQENTFVRLDEVNAEYSVILSENLDGVGRFYLHTSRSALSIDDTILNTISIYKSSENTLRVTGLSQGNTTVKLFNALGKQILRNSFSTNNGVQDVHLPKLATGVYITQVETEAGKINKKIILE